MNEIPPRRYWPYDEVTATRDSSSRFSFSTPWIKTNIDVEESDAETVAELAAKISSGNLAADDIGSLTWLFSGLTKFPLSYVLPEAPPTDGDLHEVANSTLSSESPKAMAAQIAGELGCEKRSSEIFGLFASEWKWDVDSAMAFSRSGAGFDPLALFSVARRYHLLEAIEENKTEELNAHVRTLTGEAFHHAMALMVRQNHYVTQQCDAALRPSLSIAGKAAVHVSEFIRAESGHDKILNKALKLMNVEPEAVPVLPPVFFLMEIFRYVSGRNFLAFALVVDMFERSSYQEQDPLASLLEQGGLHQAARQIDVHREINDSGGHENVAAEFLSSMGAVSEEYAREAFHLAELVTQTLHLFSAAVLAEIKRFR